MLEGGCAVFEGSADARPRNGKCKEGGGRLRNTSQGLAEEDALLEQGPSLTDTWQGPRGSCEEPLQMLHGIPGVLKPGKAPSSAQSICSTTWIYEYHFGLKKLHLILFFQSFPQLQT